MSRPKAVRCAIYTRVSTDHGLEQDFNSLDAQYDAAQAYIRSQAHAGWTLVRARYDDGGFSGGSMERPALQALLADVAARRIDIVVVYKVDRLTRSLADFAKLVELFDAHGVSFVSVTQQFNTTTSMGRLTLNVLLSFAQFEREVTAERIRDKIAASKRKGLWVGGMVPLGYTSKDRKIEVVHAEAEHVRTIFRRYLECGSLNALMVDLRSRGIVTKHRVLSTGRTIGGIPFTRGPLLHLLRNRFYIGEVAFKGEVLPGEQAVIVDRDLFDAVQARLDAQRNGSASRRVSSQAPLTGRIFDSRGNRMTPSTGRRHGVGYRYYVSSALLHGRAEEAGVVARVPAAEIEAVVAAAVREHGAGELTSDDDRHLITTAVARVEVRADGLAVTVGGSRPSRESDGHDDAGQDREDGDRPDLETIWVPWRKAPSRRRREILLPTGAAGADDRPIRAETRATLVAAIARGRSWLAEIVRGGVDTAEAIAVREGCSVRHVNKIISLAFLAPDLVEAAVAGRLPRGIGVARLSDPPAEWTRQRHMLGLPG
ncbi:recombinase family protein [Rhodoplanes roseus]|uniref:Recombinase n=1 Tax=Rhodoplanes roseus TaxID=29409 RepID=A0A327KPZ6_9BRAD|nr:recombinase family protein [Rhodoplanes roseus]RAI40471.1 recombinase [Rhodoplanes roseus]